MGDLRFLTGEQKEKARENIRQIISKNLPETRATISFMDGIPSMPPTPGNAALVIQFNDISVALNYGEVNAGNPGSRAAGHISYVANYLDCLDGLGASVKKHMRREKLLT